MRYVCHIQMDLRYAHGKNYSTQQKHNNNNNSAMQQGLRLFNSTLNIDSYSNSVCFGTSRSCNLLRNVIVFTFDICTDMSNTCSTNMKKVCKLFPNLNKTYCEKLSELPLTEKRRIYALNRKFLSTKIQNVCRQYKLKVLSRKVEGLDPMKPQQPFVLCREGAKFYLHLQNR